MRGELSAVVGERALDELEDGATYGDYNTTAAITHPFDQQFLNYPEYPTDGSAYTLNNYRKESAVGSSWRMVYPLSDREQSVCVLPGGNSGEYFSDRYDDQLRLWTDGKYKPMNRDLAGETVITFERREGDR